MKMDSVFYRPETLSSLPICCCRDANRNGSRDERGFRAFVKDLSIQQSFCMASSVSKVVWKENRHRLLFTDDTSLVLETQDHADHATYQCRGNVARSTWRFDCVSPQVFAPGCVVSPGTTWVFLLVFSWYFFSPYATYSGATVQKSALPSSQAALSHLLAQNGKNPILSRF